MSQYKVTKRDKYDITFALFIKLRDICCQRCGKQTGQLECSHIVGRGHSAALRCDPRNAKLLCNSCHRWWHSNPILSADWLKGVIGQRAYDCLILMGNKPTKWKQWDKDQNRKIQQDAITSMEAGNPMKPFNRMYKSGLKRG